MSTDTVSSRRATASEVLSNPFYRTKAVFMVASFLALALSVSLWFSGSEEEGLFVGLWVPAIQSLGALLLVGERPQPVVIEARVDEQ